MGTRKSLVSPSATSSANSAKELAREVTELAIPLFSEWLTEIDQRSSTTTGPP
jgi:hypothetical protein